MSDSNTPQDPFAAGREPAQPGAGGSGETPPPPPYGAPPPPPDYRAPAPGPGAQPPAPYGAQQYGAQAPGGYGAPQAPYYGQAAPYPRNSLAIWSLVLGIVAFVLLCGFVTGIPAIIVGHQAKRAAARGEANNEGMATAGIVLGWIATAVGVLLLIGLGALIATGNWDGSSYNFESDY